MKSQWTGFQSPFQAKSGAFTYKRALGRKYNSEERALRIFDRFLIEHDVSALDEVTPELIVAFLASRRRPRPRGHNELLGVVRRLFDWMVGQASSPDPPYRAHLGGRPPGGSRSCSVVTRRGRFWTKQIGFLTTRMHPFAVPPIERTSR